MLRFVNYEFFKVSLFLRQKTGVLNGDFAFKLYDTYGLAPETISELASIESLSFEKNDFVQALENAKMRSKVASGQMQQNLLSQTSLRLLESKKVTKTNDGYKYRYTFVDDGYEFPSVNSTILGFVVDGIWELIITHYHILLNSRLINIFLLSITLMDWIFVISLIQTCLVGKLISETEPLAFDDDQTILKGTVAQSGKVVGANSIINATTEIGIILDKTPFYSAEGGQSSDKGFIKMGNLLFNVEKVHKIRGYVVHSGHFVTWDTESVWKRIIWKSRFSIFE